jgi:hypothetical protein
MDIKLDLDPKQIEQEVIRAIAASAFGDNLKKAVETAIKNLGNGNWYSDQLTKYVEAEMRTMISATIQTQYAETIKAAIAKSITPDVLERVVGKVSDKVLSELKLDRW